MKAQAQYLFAVLFEDGHQEHVYSPSRCASTVNGILEGMYGDEVPTIETIRRLPGMVPMDRPVTGVLMGVE